MSLLRIAARVANPASPEVRDDGGGAMWQAGLTRPEGMTIDQCLEALRPKSKFPLGKWEEVQDDGDRFPVILVEVNDPKFEKYIERYGQYSVRAKLGKDTIVLQIEDA